LICAHVGNRCALIHAHKRNGFQFPDFPSTSGSLPMTFARGRHSARYRYLEISMYTERLLLRLCPELATALKQNRALTGVSASEYVRRAIRLALFADRQAANRDAAKREPVQVEAR
jgi:hypothetical protein